MLRSSACTMKTLTEESIERIWEIVLHDARMVLKTAQDSPAAAFDLACESARHRLPIFTWLLEYKSEQCKLTALERASEAARLVAPCAVDTLEHDVARTSMQLELHKTRLRGALIQLSPVVKQRLLSMACEQPARIPSISSGLLRSGLYKLRWRFNTLIAQRLPLRSQEAYERTKAELVDKWLARVVELHRMANPHTTAIDLVMTVKQQLAPAGGHGRTSDASEQAKHPGSALARVCKGQTSVASWALTTHVVNSAWVHTVAMRTVAQRLVLLVALGARLVTARAQRRLVHGMGRLRIQPG